jgi:hypothetical protein
MVQGLRELRRANYPALTEDQRTTLTTALFTAADEYRKAASKLEKDGEPGWERLAEQFDRQSEAADALRDQIEQADRVVLE